MGLKSKGDHRHGQTGGGNCGLPLETRLAPWGSHRIASGRHAGSGYADVRGVRQRAEACGGAARAITDISLDMGLAYQASTRKLSPKAKISFNPFHDATPADEALDQMRRAGVERSVALRASAHMIR